LWWDTVDLFTVMADIEVRTLTLKFLFQEKDIGNKFLNACISLLEVKGLNVANSYSTSLDI
jgi:hypothetical protein